LRAEYAGQRTQALRQKAKVSPAARTMPKLKTAIATGSYAGINMVGPSVAPTPTIQIATEQKFRKPTLWVSDPVFRIYIMRDPRSQGRFFWTRGSLSLDKSP